MEPQSGELGEQEGLFPAIDVNAESWRYTAIRQSPRTKRPAAAFSRGMPVVCETFGVWAEGLVAEAWPSRGDKPPTLAICLKLDISSLCNDCDDPSCGDRYWAMGDWGGVLTREDLEKIINRSRSLATSIPGNYGVEAYKQAVQLLGMIEELEARQKG